MQAEVQGKQVGRAVRGAMLGGLVVALAACGSLNPFGSTAPAQPVAPMSEATKAQLKAQESQRNYGTHANSGTIWGLFNSGGDPNVSVGVNKYLWRASLDVLNFLPIESVDPFTGVIVTGYGTPPGGGRAYRATIYVQDPALDARSLKVALSTSGGPVDAATVRAVEDAILTRARQLCVADGKL